MKGLERVQEILGVRRRVRVEGGLLREMGEVCREWEEGRVGDEEYLKKMMPLYERLVTGVGEQVHLGAPAAKLRYTEQGIVPFIEVALVHGPVREEER